MKALKICRIKFGSCSSISVFLALPTFVLLPWIEGIYSAVPPQQLACGKNCSVCTPKQLKTVAQSITVKIFSEQGWGSGFLLQNQGATYTILTNQHVVSAGKPTYKIQAPDGQFYLAQFQGSLSRTQSDLAILKFDTFGKKYAIASLALSKNVAVGNKVFGGGFPWDDERLTEKINALNSANKNTLSKNFLSSNSKAQSGNGNLLQTDIKRTPNSKFSQANFNYPEGFGFRLTQGRISLLPEKPIQHGYQIGYTNPIQKGMSGGPLLNHQGLVIGINGMHAYPLWGNPYTYEDGTQPSAILQKQMSELAFAIPIERLRGLALELTTRLSNPAYLNDQVYSFPLRNQVWLSQRPSSINNGVTNPVLRSWVKTKDGETSCEPFQPTDEDDPGV